MQKKEVRDRIEEIGVLPAIRVSTKQDATYAAETVYRAGITVAEITMTVPSGLEVISQLAKSHPDMVVGAGTVLNVETAKRCVDAGAKFLTSPGLVLKVVEYALKHNVIVLPGALTPTEVIAAWEAGADFVKVFPCSASGGANYIRALKEPLPQVPLIATGGVNQVTTPAFIHAGAIAVGVGHELIPREALQFHHENQIFELARRFLAMVRDARAEMAGRNQ